MNIKTLAKLSLIGLTYIYTAKLIDTLFHGLFRPASMAGIVVGLNILAGLAQLLFFITLYWQFVPQDKQALRFAAYLAIIGSTIALLPKLLSMGLIFQEQAPFFFIRHSVHISTFCPWLAAILMLAFSLIFLLECSSRQDEFLKYGFAAGAVGWFIMASAQSLVVINYLTSGRLVWLADLFASGQIVFVTVSSLSFLSLIIFYLTFTRRNFSGSQQMVSLKTEDLS